MLQAQENGSTFRATYDLENRLTAVSGSASMTLIYDPRGRLQQLTIVSTAQQFLYDGDSLIAEYNSSGTVLRRYVPGRSVDETLVWYEGSSLATPSWLHTDQQGSTVAVWAYCLMPNHVHLILVPRDADGLRAALADAHRRYSREINFREDWRGYLWQGRFASFPMDDNYLLACARYVELNPVRARLAGRARDWRWSSARAHLKGQDDALVGVAPLLERVKDWKGFLDEGLDSVAREVIRASERTGRPLGDKGFIRKLEKKLDRTLARRKPGPKPAGHADQPKLL